MRDQELSGAVQPAPATALTKGEVTFITTIILVGLGLMGWAVARFLTPPAHKESIAQKALQYLDSRTEGALSQPLSDLLADPQLEPIPSQPHPLLGQPAPGFTLRDSNNKPYRLRDLTARGPVVVIFYYGYFCDHCVAQLFGVHRDIKLFQELGASVVAISPDTAEHSRGKLSEYGGFAFPLLSDTPKEVARAYGIYTPPQGDKDENLDHATFVVGRDGKVVWVDSGAEPFLQNRTLLYELAKIEKRLPALGRENPASSSAPAPRTPPRR